MKFKQCIEREAYVVLHGQTWRFRAFKYAVIVPIVSVMYAWKGAAVTGWSLLAASVVAIAIHLVFRWKTGAWTRSWGPYKKLDLPK